MSNRLPSKEAAAMRIRTRKALVAVAEQWGRDRGIDVRELLHRLRTAPVEPPRAEDATP